MEEVRPLQLSLAPRSLLNLELHLAGCLDWFCAIKRRAGLLR
jgi:hypothetical protein